MIVYNSDWISERIVLKKTRDTGQFPAVNCNKARNRYVNVHDVVVQEVAVLTAHHAILTNAYPMTAGTVNSICYTTIGCRPHRSKSGN